MHGTTTAVLWAIALATVFAVRSDRNARNSMKMLLVNVKTGAAQTAGAVLSSGDSYFGSLRK